MLSGTNFEYTRSYNQRVVLQTVRLFEPISRAEIARETKLNIQTVSNIVDELLERGVVETGARRMSGARGQPPTEIKLNPDGAFSIGLHLDRDHLTGVLVNLQGHTLERVHFEVAYPTPEQAVVLMLEIVARFERQVKDERKSLWGIGIATPGPIEDASRRLISPPDFPGWDGVSLLDEIGTPTNQPVFVEKDGNAAAIGERWYGAGRAYKDFVYIYLGPGIGGGLILEGHPYRGAMGHAAEFGDVVRTTTNLAAGRGWDDASAENAVDLAILYRLMAKRGITVRDPQHLEQLFDAGEPLVLQWLENTAKLLVPPLMILEDLFDPEAVIFGGRLTEPLLNHLLERLRSSLPSRMIRGVPRACRFERSQLVKDAACLGAASLPFFDAIAPSRDALLKQANASR
jgi:predicted NBD/HSP70 family sugar kinase